MRQFEVYAGRPNTPLARLASAVMPEFARWTKLRHFAFGFDKMDCVGKLSIETERDDGGASHRECLPCF